MQRMKFGAPASGGKMATASGATTIAISCGMKLRPTSDTTAKETNDNDPVNTKI